MYIFGSAEMLLYVSIWYSTVQMFGVSKIFTKIFLALIIIRNFSWAQKSAY